MIPGSIKANSVQWDITHDKLTTGVMKVPQRVLLIGTKNSDALCTENTQYEVTSAEQVGNLAGFGSELHLMARYAELGQGAFPVPVTIIAETPATGTAAATVLNISDTNLENGSLILKIAGEVITLGINNQDTLQAIAEQVALAINSVPNCPLKAEVTTDRSTPPVASEDITLTSKFIGTKANSIQFSVEESPVGFNYNTSVLTGGAGEADISAQLNAVSEGDIFTQVVHSYSSLTNLQKIEEWEAARWAPAVKKGFVAFTCIPGTLSEVKAITSTRNSFVSSITGIQDSKTYPAAVAASIAVNVALSAGNDPARQLHGISLHGVDMPSASGEWSYQERDIAVQSGCSTINCKGGAVRIDQLVNTYQKTATGGDAPDVDRKICTVNVLIFVQYDQDQLFTSYADAKLYPDGVYLPSNQKIMSPDLCRNILLNRYQVYQKLGIVTDFEKYKNTLAVEIDSVNLERLNVRQELQVVGNLRISAITTGFSFAKGGA